MIPDHKSVGAAADSAHEYFLKQFLLTGQKDKASLEMCAYSLHTRLRPPRTLTTLPPSH